MTRHPLDSNVSGNAAKRQSSAPRVNWMTAQLNEDLSFSSPKTVEVRRGILQLPGGRTDLVHWFSAMLAIPDEVQSRDGLRYPFQRLRAYLRERWPDPIQARFEALLHNLTSACFERDPSFGDRRLFGISSCVLR